MTGFSCISPGAGHPMLGAMNKMLWMALFALGMVACQSAGTGSGQVRGTQKPVAFTWESRDSVSGDMTATFGNGRVFKGKYIQITDRTKAEDLDVLWDGWGERNSGNWRHWSRGPDREFWKVYDGRVLANLHSSDGERMRCRFELNSEPRGMAGGGDGRCQVSDSGREIKAEFRRKS
jgi:hypothetical protein